MRILGIDPSLTSLGWGVIDHVGSKLTHVANGQCKTQGTDLARRLVTLHYGLSDVISSYNPDCAAVEETFVNKDARGTLKLGQARGVAMLVPALFGLAIGEYSPNRVKKAVVGVGHASKAQIAQMVRFLLPGVVLEGSDAADALAVAICHAHFYSTEKVIKAAL